MERDVAKENLNGQVQKGMEMYMKVSGIKINSQEMVSTTGLMGKDTKANGLMVPCKVMGTSNILKVILTKVNFITFKNVAMELIHGQKELFTKVNLNKII